MRHPSRLGACRWCVVARFRPLAGWRGDGDSRETFRRRYEQGDTAHADKGPDAQDSWIIFSRGNELLGDHAITRGRNASERINSVTTFTGQSLTGGEGSTSLLTLAATSGDYNPATHQEIPAGGRSQAVALAFGKGRVVITGDAAMLSAQAEGNVRFGMQRAGNDDRQFALNIMHWLSGLLN